MNLPIAGAMLLALTLPALAAGPMPYSAATECVPYAEAMHTIDNAGGHVLSQTKAEFSRNAELLTYEYHGVVAITGVARNRTCVYMPPAIVGRFNQDPGIL